MLSWMIAIDLERSEIMMTIVVIGKFWHQNSNWYNTFIY